MTVAIPHPARHYIVYLLSKRIHEAKAIIAHMGELGLQVPYDGFALEDLTLAILRARASLVFPSPFNPRAAVPNEATVKWLQHHRVHDIWRGAGQVAKATELLAEPHIRHLLELLLLGPLTASAIADRVAARFGLPTHAMNTAVVRAYSHYFWDVQALDPSDWGNFVKRHYKGQVADEYKAAYQAPRNKAGAAFTIALADKDPQLLSPADRYETAGAMAFGLLMHHSLADTPSTGHTFAAAAALNMMRIADEQLALHRGASSDLIAELARFQTVYAQTPVRKITDATYINRPVLEAENKVIDVESDPEGTP